ncbi:UDP-N-acetylmuramyl pentapeptide phosphotransferase/UDP-N-acetylglucosamine-1-phosphate transferase [Corynebacterium kutscheri]|uniref:UDP-N-acetylmuramyl pentapeptide phosphotransferase/UDP-N-acetylglucosamine-1-phosphate transferase n=1 Tax=Corynebacterium kutscheri TaxID=35755 RepID=A0A0F6R137_9CORY|nr:MraY family glycosyltransferase [Corynebacterium kutscheri]AKE41645.1 UDP-N-acetylmuramyl pentapeptide phosphotransferase/UDP-N-acetylglucosamine-1-phosphate transferase [Corynebacterium kutscheri]VEH09972.1 Undecaprenyl-phosphate alpha-N-acetylglucosaminyl 1-phosphate transferase [Corynebacterium kutscheri]
MGAGVAGVPLRELGLILLVAAALTYLSTGIVRYLMVKTGQISEIRERDVHAVPTPRLGGVAMFTGFLGAVLLASQLPALTRGFQPVTPEMSAVLWGAFIIVIVGVVDDLVELDALTKLIGQFLAAVVMSLLGLTWTLLFVPFGGGTTLVLDQFSSTLVTTLFTVTLINAINFVDGLDGLAAGLGMIAGLAILVFSLTILHDQGGMVSAYPPAIIAAALVGICVGFLPHNFEPARIFMGDSGSMLIGILLAAASTSASGKINMSLYGTVDMIALLSPILVVIAAVFIPLLDLFMAVVRRMSKGMHPFSADKMHLHHRLLSLGHTHRRVVLILYLWVSVIAFGAVSFSVVPTLVAVIGIVIAAIIALIATWGPVRRARVVTNDARRLKILKETEPR